MTKRSIAATLAPFALAACSGTAASPPPLREAASALAAPHANARAGKHTLFVATLLGAGVSVFDGDSKKNPPPIASITTGVSQPTGLATDTLGTLYVANAGSSNVTEYPAGQTTPSNTLANGIAAPTAIAVDATGTVAVANGGAPTNKVVEFAAGSSAPTTTIGCAIAPQALAYDSAGNLYIGDLGSGPPQQSRVYKVAAGTSTCTNLGFKGISIVGGLAVDASGNLWVDDRGRAIYLFPPGAKYPDQFRITEFGSPWAIAFDSRLDLYIADSDSGVFRAPYHRTSPLIAWNNSFTFPIAIAVSTSS